MLTFRILGAIEINTPTRTVRSKGALQSVLLVTLLVNARQLVLTEALIDELWGPQPPRRVENALQAHISRLRRRLASLELDATTPRLIASSSGYRFLVDDEELDAALFVQSLERIRSQAGGSGPTSGDELRRILSLWRGPVFGGFVGNRMCQAAAARYEESRLAALELLFDHELRCGHHKRIIPELSELLVEHSYKERFRQQLMIALYRAGRHADALNVYRELWRRLTGELGLEPSPAMRDYERAVLEQDPILER